MYVKTTKPERKGRKKNSAHRYHHSSSPALTTTSSQVIIDESRYPPSPQHRYEEMDYRIHRGRDGSDNCIEEPYKFRHQPLPSTSTTSSSFVEVSVQNPTQLFLLMNLHLWAQAMKHLKLHPSDARVWITSSTHTNLPLHLACLMLSSSARGDPPPPPLHFMEALVHAYPDAAAEKNLEGSLPLHLASECIDITSRYMESEGILLLLSKVYPAGLSEKDKEGRVPLQILEERGVSAIGNKIGKSGLIRYMKSQTKIGSRSETRPDQNDDPNDDDNNTLHGFVTPKNMHTVGTPNSAKPPLSDRRPRSANQSPSQYHGYDLLSTPTSNHGYDLISTPANSFHVESSPRTNIPPSYHHKETRDMTNAENNMHMHTSPRPSEYVLLSPRVVPSPHQPHHNNNELEVVRLHMMEAKYLKLQSEFDNLNATHTGTVSELKAQTKKAEESQHKINVLNESEDNRTRLNRKMEEQNNEFEAKISQQMRIHTELKEELNERTKQLQEMRARESSLLQQLLKKLENDEQERLNRDKSTMVTKEKEAAKNILLREVALKAIQAVGLLQKDMKLSAKDNSDIAAQNPSKIGLEQLLEDVDLTSTLSIRVSSQQRNSHLKGNDTLILLRPTIEDARNTQKDVTIKVQNLLQLCKRTTRLIDGIPNIPQHDFDFEETLQALARVMTTNIDLVQSIDTLLDTEENMLSNVASVTKQSLAEMDVIKPNDEGDGNTKALLEVVKVTQKTSKKLESLARTISQLNFSEASLKEEDLKKCVRATDEITKVFKLSLEHLSRDAEKIRGIADAAISAYKKL